MRIGVNPEKFKGEENHQYHHRVVVVCYIPNTTEDYYKESLIVLKKCLDSLVATINPETTCITLLNNASIPEVDAIAKEMLANKTLNKYVVFAENKGKVYAVIDEVRSVFETYVTIADCDVLFMNRWENAVFDVFINNHKAGVVSPLPCPNGAFTNNEAIFFDNFWKGNIKYDSFVLKEELDLLQQGINSPGLFKRNGKPDWNLKQYVLKNGQNAVIGANHFVATYKSYVFRNETDFPRMKFVNGYEDDFMDKLVCSRGLYRLSTMNCYAYHIGNKIDEFSSNYIFEVGLNEEKVIFDNKLNIREIRKSKMISSIKKTGFKILRKLVKL